MSGHNNDNGKVDEIIREPLPRGSLLRHNRSIRRLWQLVIEGLCNRARLIALDMHAQQIGGVVAGCEDSTDRTMGKRQYLQ